MYEISIDKISYLAIQIAEKNSKKIINNYLSYEYPLPSKCSLVLMSEVSQPKRDGDRIWFRSEEAIKEILILMTQRNSLPPIEVFSKERKKSDFYTVRDGFHRYYASLVLHYEFIPVKINDWDFEDS
jgi:hypothetical protein